MKAVESGKVTLDSGELGTRGALHLDQGIVVTRHASQRKTVAQVIVSVAVRGLQSGERGAVLRVDEPCAQGDAPFHRFKGSAERGENRLNAGPSDI